MTKNEKQPKTDDLVLKIRRGEKTMEFSLPHLQDVPESTRLAMEKVVQRDYEALMELSRH